MNISTSKTRAIILRVFPKGTRRYKFILPIFRFSYNLITLKVPRRILSRVVNSIGIFQDQYTPESFGCTILYTDNLTLFPKYPFVERIKADRQPVKVSLISTVRNEARNINDWIDCIFQQKRLPDEIILVDGGSSDGTIEILHSLVKKSPVPIHIIRKPGVNIAQGRNIAIEHAKYPVIAATDFGCRPEKEWLENITAPFERDDQIEMVSGWYVAEDRSGNIIHRRSWPVLDQVDPGSFVPSSRSIAFTKEIWRKANGYPEWLTLTGEDTYFALELKKYARKTAFVPEAVVRWIAPDTVLSYWKKIYNWCVGDGESGLNSSLYIYDFKWLAAGGVFAVFTLILMVISLLLNTIFVYTAVASFLLVSMILIGFSFHKKGLTLLDFYIETGAKAARLSGFLKGVKRRKEINNKRFSLVKGVYFILAGVPIYDTGGGSRGAQIAFELLRQHYLVVYINKFESYESTNIGLQYRHPNLLTYSIPQFSWGKFINEYGQIIYNKQIGALIEFPLKDFLPIIEELQKVKAAVCYDCLDDWNTQLGSTWYDKKIEECIASASNVLVATAPILAERLEKITGRPVALVPNAVNLRLFNYYRPYPCPEDLPHGRFTIAYIGALWGDWFDWELLVDIAVAYPDAAVMVIGDYRGQCPANLPNLHFLGLKPQKSLPAYLAHTDVAIIPWIENEITYATSPLKLYEYLAMHVPVVVPNLPLLKNIPYVFLSSNKNEFIKNIEISRDLSIDDKEIDQFVASSSWEVRVKQINRILGIDPSKE